RPRRRRARARARRSGIGRRRAPRTRPLRASYRPCARAGPLRRAAPALRSGAASARAARECARGAARAANASRGASSRLLEAHRLAPFAAEDPCGDRAHSGFDARVDDRRVGLEPRAAARHRHVLDELDRPLERVGRERVANERDVVRIQMHADARFSARKRVQRLADDAHDLARLALQLAPDELPHDGEHERRELAEQRLIEHAELRRQRIGDRVEPRGRVPHLFAPGLETGAPPFVEAGLVAFRACLLLDLGEPLDGQERLRPRRFLGLLFGRAHRRGLPPSALPRRRDDRSPRLPGAHTYSSPRPMIAISPSSASLRTIDRISFCALSISLTLTGPLSSRSSSSASRAPFDMLRKKCCLISAVAPLSATTSISRGSSRSSLCMLRSSISSRFSNVNMSSWICTLRFASYSRMSSRIAVSDELSM